MSDKKVGITTDHLSHTQWRCCKEGFFIKNHWMEENISSTVKCPGQQSLRQVVTKFCPECFLTERDDCEVTEVLITPVLWSVVVTSDQDLPPPPPPPSSLPHSQFIIFYTLGLSVC